MTHHPWLPGPGRSRACPELVRSLLSCVGMRPFTMLLAAALLAVACRSTTESPTVKLRMQDHQMLSDAIRDAVARGDLEQAKREAASLALLSIEGPVAEVWMRKLDAMSTAAMSVVGAVDRRQAAQALGALASSCAECHRKLGRPLPAVGPEPGQASGVRPFMVRHEWAVSQMWAGLAIPSDDAWKAGAHALAEEPIVPEALTPGKTPVPRVAELEQAVHDLGRRAEAADRSPDRAELFGDVLATCGECHQWLGGGPRPESDP